MVFPTKYPSINSRCHIRAPISETLCPSVSWPQHTCPFSLSLYYWYLSLKLHTSMQWRLCCRFSFDYDVYLSIGTVWFFWLWWTASTSSVTPMLDPQAGAMMHMCFTIPSCQEQWEDQHCRALPFVLALLLLPVFLCDQAFPLTPNLMKHFPGSNNTPAERNFNYELSKTRRIVLLP